MRTLLLYDGRMSSAERIADRLCYLIGSSRVCEISEAPDDLAPYDGFCFVFNFYGAVSAGKTQAFISAHRAELLNRRVVMAGIGFSDLGYTKFVSDCEKRAGLENFCGIFISSEAETLRSGYEISRILREPEDELSEHMLRERIVSCIMTHNILALATAGKDYLRCSPFRYLYRDGVFYIPNEGGHTFRGILENGRAFAAVFDTDGPGADAGVCLRVECSAIPVDDGSDEYDAVMTEAGFGLEKREAFPVTLYLLKLIPLRYEYQDPSLPAEGYDLRQFLDTAFRKQLREDAAAFATAEESREREEAELMRIAEENRREAELKKAEEARDAESRVSSERLRENAAELDEIEAEVREDVAKVVREIFTEVSDDAEDAEGAEGAEPEDIAEDAEVAESEDIAEDAEVAESEDIAEDAGVAESEDIAEDAEPEDMAGDAEAEDAPEDAEAVKDAEPDVPVLVKPVMPQVRKIPDEVPSFLRSPRIDTAHLPRIDMSVLAGIGLEEKEQDKTAPADRGEADEKREGVYSILDEDDKKKKEKRFGLAELEAMEEEEEAESAREKRRRRRFFENRDERDDTLDIEEENEEEREEESGEDAETDERTGRSKRPRASSGRRKKSRRRANIFVRAGMGFASLLKIEEDDGEESGYEEARKEDDARHEAEDGYEDEAPDEDTYGAKEDVSDEEDPEEYGDDADEDDAEEYDDGYDREYDPDEDDTEDDEEEDDDDFEEDEDDDDIDDDEEEDYREETDGEEEDDDDDGDADEDAVKKKRGNRSRKKGLLFWKK